MPKSVIITFYINLIVSSATISAIPNEGLGYNRLYRTLCNDIIYHTALRKTYYIYHSTWVRLIKEKVWVPVKLLNHMGCRSYRVN